MKIQCHCGRYVDYEHPFDDFHTKFLDCGPSTCKKYVPQARPVFPDPRNRLSTSFPGAHMPTIPVGALGH